MARSPTARALECITDHPINRIEELLPWNVVDKLNQPEQVTKALAEKARVALLAQDAETIAQLLQRLDTALEKAMVEDTVIDEVLPKIKRRRAE